MAKPYRSTHTHRRTHTDSHTQASKWQVGQKMYPSEFVKLRAQLGGEMFSPCREPQSKHTGQISRRILHFKLKKSPGNSRKKRLSKSEIQVHKKSSDPCRVDEGCKYRGGGKSKETYWREKKGVAREDGGEQ